MTLDYDVFDHELSNVGIDTNDRKHSRTAIGSAVGLSVSNLLRSAADSKVVILLTDGINNHGGLDPITAAQIASDYGIRVYTIGAGLPEGRRDPIDEDTLRRIAEITGAKYYRATDTQSLQGAYDEINELERTEIEIGDVYDFNDGFVPYALVGTLALFLSIFTRRQWFEAIP